MYVGFILRLIFFINGQKNSRLNTRPVEENSLSLIIPLRNEIDNLGSLIDSIELLVRTFKNLEVLIIDDNSNDGSTAFLREREIVLNKELAIKLIYLSDGKASKKKAIMKGLELSTNNWIVQLDADCDLNVDWLNSFLKIDKSELSFIAGPVAFKSNGFWSGLLKLESWALIAVSYFGFKAKEPQMCSAANMCWDKSKLLNDDYAEIINMDEPSGDDAFLLQYFKSKNPEAMAYSWNMDSIIWTNPPDSFMGFINQRLRWASKWGAVKGVSQVLFPIALWMYHLLHFTFFLILILKGFYLTVLSVVFIKALFEMIMLKKVAKNFKESLNPILVLFMQLLYSPYVVILGLLSQFTRYSWK